MNSTEIARKLEGAFASMSFKLSDISPSVWAEGRRVMTSDVSNFRGPFSYNRTPYLREPIDCLRPDHPARIIAVQKGAQIGFTAGVIENGIGYIVSEHPGPIMLLNATDKLTKKIFVRVDQMIDSTGLRPHIRPNRIKKGNNRTGDTQESKEFIGGSLIGGSTSNHKAIRSDAIQYGFIDDFEAAPHESKQSGSTMDLIEMRFSSYYDKMKLYLISTPEIKQTSNIEPAFLMGDQRKWNVPCPCCGSYIVLEWSIENKKKKIQGGITWKTNAKGELDRKSVGYTCQNCGEFFDESHKYEMNLNGMWVPTNEPNDPSIYSYHVPSLYAPPGMYDWTYYVSKFLEACPPGEAVNQGKLKTFHNTALGLTWEERGAAPQVTDLMMNTRDYAIGTVPFGLCEHDQGGQIVLLTCACDLNGTKQDARLDYEIVAWSENGQSYSVDHGSIGTFVPAAKRRKKKYNDDRPRWTYDFGVANSVWPAFMEVLQKEYPTDVNSASQITLAGVDTGHFTEDAYDFIKRATDRGLRVVGVKGKDEHKFRKYGLDTPPFKLSRERSDLYLVEVNQLKDDIANQMKLKWMDRESIGQPVGFMNFPNPEGGKYTMKSYFSHYEAEHRVLERNASNTIVGSRWVKRNASVMNHLFDCHVYNKALREIFAHAVCKEAGINRPTWKQYCDIITGKV